MACAGASRVLMARMRESLGNVEASKSERYTGAGIVDSGVESERETVLIFDNGGRICMLFLRNEAFTKGSFVKLEFGDGQNDTVNF